MSNTKCPKCQSENTYQDGNLWICPECQHEWTEHDQQSAKAVNDKTAAGEANALDGLVRDANGQVLQDGDSVVVIKDLKIKGASSTIKSGTKVKNIRLHDAGDGHDISCKIDGLGSINLKGMFVRKS